MNVEACKSCCGQCVSRCAFRDANTLPSKAKLKSTKIKFEVCMERRGSVCWNDT